MTEKQWQDILQFAGGQTIANMMKKQNRTSPQAGTYGRADKDHLYIPIGPWGAAIVPEALVPKNMQSDYSETFERGCKSLFDKAFDTDMCALRQVKSKNIDPHTTTLVEDGQKGACTYVDSRIFNKLCTGKTRAIHHAGDPISLVYFTQDYGVPVAMCAAVRVALPTPENGNDKEEPAC